MLLATAACKGSSPPASHSLAAASSAPPASSTTPSAPTVVPSRAAAVAIEPGLLGVLPRAIDGHPVEESPEVEAANAADPTIPDEVRAMAAAFVHDDELSNWAVVTVVALRSGVLDDAFYRSWRATFDVGACEPAGGVTGSAAAPIGDRMVDIGRCAGGVNTYHARLAGDRLISITAVGEGRYGELVMAGLSE